MNGYGWILLRASAASPHGALEPEPDRRDDERARADARLWAAYRAWMQLHPDPWLLWHLAEANNNDRGVLTFSVSRNHRASGVWAMLDWIAEHGPGSYGLFSVHDDEDTADNTAYGRGGTDHSDRFRVHRLVRGAWTEHPDPFFGPVWPDLEP